MSCERGEPAGLCGLRKQVKDVKQRPFELRRKKANSPALREERGKGASLLKRESVPACLEFFIVCILCGFMLLDAGYF